MFMLASTTRALVVVLYVVTSALSTTLFKPINRP